VLGDLEPWRDGLRLAGVSVDGHTASPDLVVAPARLARQALATGARSVLLEGRGGSKTLERAGYSVRRFLPLPSLDDPTVVLPVERGPAFAYALEEWRPARTLPKRLRDRLASALVHVGAFPAARVEQALGLRNPGPPFAIAAAGALGVPADASWFLWLGQSDPLARVAFYVFAPGQRRPEWVLKLARVEGVRDSFEKDEHGLTLAAAAGGVAAAHAPRLFGRFEAGGLEASVESAAPGEPLSGLIARDRVLARAAIDEIAAWIIDLGRDTAGPADALAEERQRLKTDVLPSWRHQGVTPDLVDTLPALPAVLQHNDLGSWNIIVRPGDGFVAVDWESARRFGLPLWDLLYFLVDVLPLLEGATTPERRTAGALRIMRGESSASSVFFRWLDRGVAASDVPRSTVPMLATLCWLHHGLSHLPRRHAAERAEPGAAAVLSPIDRLAPLWLDDPALGLEWKAWRP
jgi:hypothetical protein